MELVAGRLHYSAVDGETNSATDESCFKLKALEGNEAYAPGVTTEDDYVNTVKTAPAGGVVVDFALLKGKNRSAVEAPYRLTFSNCQWGSYLMGFLLNLEVTRSGAAEGWGVQRWRQKRSRR